MPIAVIGATTTAEAKSAVPDVAELAGDLAAQELSWETCDFGDPAYNEAFNKPNVKCATVEVPRDWHHPDNGKTWDIRISHVSNIDVDNPRYQGTVFANPGGPGGSGLVWGPALTQLAPDLAPYYNFVGFDPRGVGQSSHAECSYEWDPASTDPNAEVKAAGEACSTDEDVRTISTEQTVYDMDFIRHLLDAPKLSYLGYSYGTWLGTWYENVFGAKYGDKFLLDSSIDSREPTLEETWNLQPIARDRQFKLHMINWIARHDASYELGEDPQAIHDRYFAATAKLDPDVVLLIWILLGGASAFSNNDDYPLAGEVVKILIEEGEAASTAARAAARANPADRASDLLTKIEKRSSGSEKSRVQQAKDRIAPLTSVPTRSTPESEAKRPRATETATLDSPFDFIRCNDGQWTQGTAYWQKHNEKLARKAPLSNQWGLLEVPICAFWQTGTLMPVADDSFPDTIVIQGEMDSQTAWEGGYNAGTKLPNTRFIAIDNESTHGAFPYGTEAVDRKVINFFLDGKLPKNITVAQALPLPEDEITYESWAPLNNKAKHVSGEISSPWTPAERATKTLRASTVGKELLADATSDQLLRQQVLKVYGPEGVEALEESGTL
jgi:pimeloyl-ACP methyl ester carboxylesterase